MLNRGFLGVDMFYILSGFLIVTLLLREQNRNGNISLPDFYVRRVLRIFPLYYLLIALVGVGVFVVDSPGLPWSSYREAIPYLLTYTYNWVHVDALIMDISWSLATEEQFYLVWPFIIAFLSKRSACWVLAFALVINLVWVFWAASLAEPPEPLILQVTFTPILMGVMIAHLLHSRQGFKFAHDWLGRPHSTVLMTSLLLLMLNLPNEKILGLHRTMIHVAMAGWLMSLVVYEQGVAQYWLRTPFMSWSGEISYGLYLWHMVALTVVMEWIDTQGWVLFAFATSLTYILAYMSFNFYEKPFLRMKHRFKK